MDCKIKDLLSNKLEVINIGLPEFANDLEEQGATTVHVDWTPPKQLDEEVDRILDLLL